MKKYEIESLLKNFLIFFTLQLILLCVIFIQNYKQEHHNIDDQIYNKMKICSYNLKCEELQLDFVPNSKDIKLEKLYKDDNTYSFFNVPTVDNYLMKIILPKQKYSNMIKTLKKELFKNFVLYTLLIALLSFFFSLYTLRPLKDALMLNEQFIRDIIHDINTPLSALIVNFKLFQKDIGKNHKIDRMHSSISTILSLQNNLQAFLDNSPLQKDQFILVELLHERVLYFQTIYPNIEFKIKVNKDKIETNRDAFVRIIDNILSNACKYNKHDGVVKIENNSNILIIEDSGKGIKDIDKVFKRYYKEGERGVGIGMHIVNNICNELGIEITIGSEIDKGTVVSLNLKEVIVK